MLRTGALDGADVETVYLAVAKAHQCAAAVATRTTSGRPYGLTDAETLAARSGTSPAARLPAAAVT